MPIILKKMYFCRDIKMILFQFQTLNYNIMESKEFNKQLSGGNNGFLHLVLNLALLVFFIWIVVRFAKFDCLKDA